MTSDDTTGDTMSLPEVAETLAVSVRTLQRRVDDLQAVGATRTGSGWRVPAESVDRLGERLKTTRHTTSDTRQTTNDRHVACREVESELRSEVKRLQTLCEERSERLAYLERQNTQLIDQQGQATSANAALAMSLRESLHKIESTAVSTAPPDPKRSPEADEQHEGLVAGFTKRWRRR